MTPGICSGHGGTEDNLHAEEDDPTNGDAISVCIFGYVRRLEIRASLSALPTSDNPARHSVGTERRLDASSAGDWLSDG